MFRVPIVLLFCRKQTLVIKSDKEEHMQPHFLLLDIILSLKEREGIWKVSFVIYVLESMGKITLSWRVLYFLKIKTIVFLIFLSEEYRYL